MRKLLVASAAALASVLASAQASNSEPSDIMLGYYRALIEVEVSRRTDAAIEIINGPKCFRCTEPEKQYLLASIVDDEDAYRQRLLNAGFGMHEFGDPSRPSRKQKVYGRTMALLQSSIDCIDPCSIRRSICRSIMLGAGTRCSARANQNSEFMQCKNVADSTLQNCFAHPEEGESEDETEERCQSEYVEYFNANCAPIWNDVFDQCIEGEMERYNECMGNCEGEWG